MIPFSDHTLRYMKSNLLRTGHIFLFLLLTSTPSVWAFSHETAGFSVEFKGIIWPYRLGSAFVLPQEELVVTVRDEHPHSRFSAQVQSGELRKRSARTWVWKVPLASGAYKLVISRESPAEVVTLNAFVMVPRCRIQGEYLNGYRVGRYPLFPLGNLPVYKPPEGFIEVTPQIMGTSLSPHFKLSQFLCKQEDGYPKYLVMREKLILKLESILTKANQQGYSCDTLYIMSGYRTPYYNAQLGNAKYSRHLWGGAGDIFIDESPKDGQMDDLNRDGAQDWQDAVVLYEMIDEMFKGSSSKPFFGGLAWYKRSSRHGPFVHVDVRGEKARW